MSRKEQANDAAVLKLLSASGRFSVFEATATPTIAKTMDRLFDQGMLLNTGGQYPWTTVELTDKGRKVMDGNRRRPDLVARDEQEQRRRIKGRCAP
jgi:hypothetical protein